MMTREEGLELYARVLSVKAAVVALLRTVKRDDLPAVLEEEFERVRASLLANANAPDSCLSAFEEEAVALRDAAERKRT
jgi:hypothetical protein